MSGDTFDERVEALTLLSHPLLARIAAELLDLRLRSCHYCGVRPTQDTPRPSYYEMRTLLAEVSAANADGEGGHEDLWEAVDMMVSYFDPPPVRGGETSG